MTQNALFISCEISSNLSVTVKEVDGKLGRLTEFLCDIYSNNRAQTSTRSVHYIFGIKNEEITLRVNKSLLYAE